MSSQQKKLLFKYNLSKINFLVFFSFFMIAFNTVFAQKEVSKKEIISITSTFKPSIIKTGKIDFFAKTPELDNMPFSFNYIPTHGYHQTTLPTFFVKPLAFKHEDIKYDSAGLFAKLGYGNNQIRWGARHKAIPFGQGWRD